VVAHGGTAGLVIEALLAVTVIAVFAAVWLRERRARRSHNDEPV
jgi:ABC-type phosphate transport system permease subunit